jgi:hypothetical protein
MRECSNARVKLVTGNWSLRVPGPMSQVLAQGGRAACPPFYPPEAYPRWRVSALIQRRDAVATLRTFSVTYERFDKKQIHLGT